MRCGILLLDKPVGLSSNAALQRVRRLLGGSKGGHTGSLDPLASGMLPICIGEATKLAGEILAGDKTYTLRLQLGWRTASGDAEGAVIERCPVPALDPGRIEDVLQGFRGELSQVPPMYSALKRGGEPLYRLARRGEVVERAPRRIRVYELELLQCGPDWLDLRVGCSKGTYVRVLGEDLARALGSCGHLASLRREYVEPFRDRPMVTLEALERLTAEAQDPADWLLPADAAVPQLAAVRLDVAAARDLHHGRCVQGAAPAPAGTVRLYGPDGAFMGLGEREATGRLRVRRLFVAGS
ncbi:MAG: tRNA pseudouridine(55) synthase TruB [Gammaproteobacteria bacterium]|nr:tRNA pseudouridine(55) synthase TruB [Gammaproteobacteria bacterium]